jgi:UMF1 family MFS transporter
MAANFGINLGFGQTAIMGALVLVQFVAFFATLLYIKFSDKVGIKNGIYTAIFAYVFIVLGAFFVTEAWHFYILAVLIGCFQGGIQTLSRSLYSRIIPENKSGEFFGFFNMWGKFAAVFGPLIMGSATVLINNAIADQELAARIGFQSIIVLLLLGAYVFSKVDLAEGEAMAKKL